MAADNYLDKATISVTVADDGKPTKGTITTFKSVKEAAAAASYTYGADGTSITIETDAEGKFTAKADGETVASGTYAKSGTTLVATFAEAVEALGVSAGGSITFTIGANDVLTVKEEEQTPADDDPEEGKPEEQNPGDTTKYFTKFVASDLESSSSGVKYALGEKDADDTWEIVTEGSSKQVANKTASLTSYDGKTFTARLSLENAGRGIKIKIGAEKTKIIRIDATNSKSSITNAEEGVLTVGTEEWKYQISPSTKYFSVTGDSDGWVSITMKSGKANILAIEVVDTPVDTAEKTISTSVTNVSAPVLTPSDATGTDDNAEKYVTGSAISVTAATPTYSVDTYTAKADGSVAAEKAEGKATEIDNPAWTYSWTQDGAAISGATAASYTPSASGKYVVSATYKATVEGAEKTSSAATAEFDVINPNAETVKVTFAAGTGGSFAEDATTEFTIEKGKTLAQANVTAPTATPSDTTKVFKEWTSSVDGITIDNAITANVTFTATYDNKPSVTPFTEYFDKYKVGSASEWTDAPSSEVTPLSATEELLTFASGITVTCTSTTNTPKIKANTNTIGGFTTKAYCSIHKPDNGVMSIPVEGNCTIKIGYKQNNITLNNRGIRLTANATGAKVATVTGVTGDPVFATQCYYSDTVNTNEVITFKYQGGAGTITLDNVSTGVDGTSSGGYIYLYFIDISE